MAVSGLDAVLSANPAVAGSALAKSRVVCTLGPKSRSVAVIEELLRAGMAVARFNFSHGSHEYHQVRVEGGNRSGCGREERLPRPPRLLLRLD